MYSTEGDVVTVHRINPVKRLFWVHGDKHLVSSIFHTSNAVIPFFLTTRSIFPKIIAHIMHTQTVLSLCY